MVEFKLDKEKNGDDAGAEYCKVNARDFIIPTQVFVIYVPAGEVYGRVYFVCRIIVFKIDFLWKVLLWASNKKLLQSSGILSYPEKEWYLLFLNASKIDSQLHSFSNCGKNTRIRLYSNYNSNVIVIISFLLNFYSSWIQIYFLFHALLLNNHRRRTGFCWQLIIPR